MRGASGRRREAGPIDGSRHHDLLDVLALADKVLVLESGRASQSGPVAGCLLRRAADSAPKSPA